jgi:hypothetical protein
MQKIQTKVGTHHMSNKEKSQNAIAALDASRELVWTQNGRTMWGRTDEW